MAATSTTVLMPDTTTGAPGAPAGPITLAITTPTETVARTTTTAATTTPTTPAAATLRGRTAVATTTELPTRATVDRLHRPRSTTATTAVSVRATAPITPPIVITATAGTTAAETSPGRMAEATAA